MGGSSKVTRSLYRSLIKSARHFSPPSPSYAVFASLLTRTGAVVDWEECVYNVEKLRKARHIDASSAARDERPTTTNDRQTNMPKSWARDLSRSYTQLRTDYETRRSHLERAHGVGYVEEEEEEEWEDDDEDGIPFLHSDAQHARGKYRPDEDPKFLLFRHLLREYFAGGSADPTGAKVGKWPFERRQWSPNEEGYYEKGKVKQVPLMRFPSQVERGGGPSVLDLVRREFRAPTFDERLLSEAQAGESRQGGGGDDDAAGKVTYPPSSYMDNDARLQTAFYTLMELNRKLTWAETAGLTASTVQSTASDRETRRLVQSARGVSLFSTETRNDGPSGSNEHTGKSDSEEDQEFLEALKEISSSPLKCGTYLIAHPMMKGYFARSVILILDHSDGSEAATPSGDDDSTGGPSGDKGAGGTYGLIINRFSKRQVSDAPQLKQEGGSTAVQEITISLDGSSSLPIEPPGVGLKGGTFTLAQAIHADDLPDTVIQAFGDNPVREGGPVGFSLQMVHRKTRQRIDTKDKTNGDPKDNEGASGQIGGTLVPSLAQDSSHHEPTDSDEEVYFGGDVLKASYAVLNGKKASSNFSFVIGASCWAPGQLEHEIERGCWMPFRGPADMAVAGLCDHNDVTVGDGVTQPVDNLWLSIMAALGADESDLAVLNTDHELGDACDNFDR